MITNLNEIVIFDKLISQIAKCYQNKGTKKGLNHSVAIYSRIFHCFVSTSQNLALNRGKRTKI